MIERLLSRKDVAGIIGTTTKVISTWCTVGRFPRPHHLGRKAVWPESIVQEWLDKNLVQPEDDQTIGCGIEDISSARPLKNI